MRLLDLGGFHMDKDGCVGLYSDALYKKYRGRGLGKQLLYYRLKKS